MQYKILYSKESKDGVTCYVCTGNLQEFIASLKPDFYEFDIQRGIVRNYYLDSFKSTIENGEIVPPVSLTIDGKPQIDEKVLTIDEKQTEILDGLQRTFRLWMYHHIDKMVKTNKIDDYKTLINTIRESERGQYILEQYFVNAKYLKGFLPKEDGKSEYDSFLELWSRYDLVFYIWVGLDEKGIVRKMLELNAGQKPVSSIHQYELLFLHFYNDISPKLPEGMRLYRNREKEYSKVRLRRENPLEFTFASVVIAYKSFYDRKPLRVQSAGKIILDEEDINSANLTETNLLIFLKHVAQIDRFLCDKDADHIAWYGKDTTLSGIYAALGQFTAENGKMEEFEKDADTDFFVESFKKCDFQVKEFNNAYAKLSSVRVNVGNIVRNAIFSYTLDLLKGKKSSWAEYLLNKSI